MVASETGSAFEGTAAQPRQSGKIFVARVFGSPGATTRMITKPLFRGCPARAYCCRFCLDGLGAIARLIQPALHSITGMPPLIKPFVDQPAEILVVFVVTSGMIMILFSGGIMVAAAVSFAASSVVMGIPALLVPPMIEMAPAHDFPQINGLSIGKPKRLDAVFAGRPVTDRQPVIGAVDADGQISIVFCKPQNPRLHRHHQ